MLDKITALVDRNLPLDYGGACIYCGIRRNNGTPFELDHVLPVNLGGPDVNWNKVWCCRSCNRQKSDNHPWVFFKQREIEGDKVYPFTKEYVSIVLLAIEFLSHSNVRLGKRANGGVRAPET